MKFIRIIISFCLIIMINNAYLLSSTHHNFISYEQADLLYFMIKCYSNDIDKELSSLGFFVANKKSRVESHCNNNNNTTLDISLHSLLNNYKDDQGNSILHHACNVGHEQLIKELLKVENILETQNTNLETALFFAKEFKTLAILLSADPNLIHRNNNNQIPLISHIINDNIPVVKSLIQKMHQIFPCDTLQKLKQRPFNHIKSLDMARVLMKTITCTSTIANNQIIQLEKPTPQQLAFFASINTQPNINITNIFNETLLHYAARENRYDIAQILLQKNIDLYAQNSTGQTALHVATYHNYPELIGLLLGYAIHLESKGTAHAKSMLLEKKDIDGSTALMTATLQNNSNIALDLIQNGADIFTVNNYKHSLLHCVKDPMLAQRLINLKLDVQKEGIFNHTPLHFAKNEQIAQILINNKANPHIVTIDNQTPLHTAKTAAIAQVLINAKAIINTQNHRGQIPLHCAVTKNNIPLCKLLLKHNADQTIKDFDRNTAAQSIKCLAKNSFFDIEDLEVLLQNKPRIPASMQWDIQDILAEPNLEKRQDHFN